MALVYRCIAALVSFMALAASTTATAQTSASSSSSGGPGCIPNPPPADSGCQPVNVPEPESGAVFGMAIGGLALARILARRRRD